MYSYATIFGVMFIEFAFAGQPQLLNKIMALKNPKDMSKMIWTWIFASFCCLLVMFGGLYMRAINPSLKVADNAVIEYVKLFHPVISTILSVAIVAALMSTACGLILVITTCISNDLFLKTLVKHGIINMEEEKAERVAYGMTKFCRPLSARFHCTLYSTRHRSWASWSGSAFPVYPRQPWLP
jgi:Na+/pantothenate symporter